MAKTHTFKLKSGGIKQLNFQTVDYEYNGNILGFIHKGK